VNTPLVPLGRPHGERADAARNREHLLEVAREMVAEHGVECVTMDGLAERASLGKGTVFRRFGTRAGIFRALLEADELVFQKEVMHGEPPLGPGAAPVSRLVAYGHARVAFLYDHFAIARAAIDRNGPASGAAVEFTRIHLRMLLAQADPEIPNLDNLAVQLTTALEGPILLALHLPEPPGAAEACGGLADSWQTLIERVCRA
jgi:AcrR family transcriptional regulator